MAHVVAVAIAAALSHRHTERQVLGRKGHGCWGAGAVPEVLHGSRALVHTRLAPARCQVRLPESSPFTCLAPRLLVLPPHIAAAPGSNSSLPTTLLCDLGQ